MSAAFWPSQRAQTAPDPQNPGWVNDSIANDELRQLIEWKGNETLPVCVHSDVFKGRKNGCKRAMRVMSCPITIIMRSPTNKEDSFAVR